MLGFGGDRVGAKRKERVVEELYNATYTTDEAEVTSHSERSGEHSMSLKNRMRAESGTCNVCSAPCSSCLHLNLALMGSKSEEFSDETSRGTNGSQLSINEGDVLHSLKGRPYDNLQNTASEASNLLSVNSSHDSFSVNADRRTFRSSDISDASEDFRANPKFSSSGAGAADQLSPKAVIGLDKRTSNRYENPKGAEGHDDNISCVSRADDANTAVTGNDRSVGIKNLSHNLGSVSSLGSEEMVKAPSCQKLDLFDIPPVEKVGESRVSPKAGSPVSHSQSNKCPVEGSSDASTKVYPKTEAIYKDSGEPPDEALNGLDEDKQELTSTQLAKLPNVQPFHSASGDETDESDIVEQDVKVCDICGDAGREDLLAICSKCSDGAEHTYCMKEMLQKVPEADWMCEECKFAEETEKQKQGVDLEGKRLNKPTTSTQSSGKRHAENLDTAAPTAKRQAVETSMRSPKPISPGKTAALSRDVSFKSLDKGKVRQASFGNNSSNDAVETARSPSGVIPQTTKGTLLKSSSFNTVNSKAKVKPVDEVVLQKRKGSRDLASLDIKPPSRVMNKSMSFRAPSSGCLSAGESKSRAFSPRPSNVHDLKGLKLVKERNALERKSLSRLDRSLTASSMSTSVSMPKVDQKLTPLGESESFLSASSNRESKVKSEGKSITLTKSNSNKDRKGSEASCTPVGALPTSVMCSSPVGHKSNLVTPKEEPTSSSSWTAEKPCSNVNAIVQDGSFRSVESTYNGDKSSSCRSRQSLNAGSKGVLSKKCKEVGQDAQSCPLGLQVSGSDVSAGRNSRVDMVKDNKLKAAIEAAMHKLPGTFGRGRVNDQLDGLGVVNMDLNCASQDPTLFSDKMKGTHEVPIKKESAANKLMPVSDSSKISAVPEHEYIWQGGFELHRVGKLQDLCGGIQAHLSSCASPKVLEMVNKFPVNIHLNEVPRVSTWPTMFHECGAKEDNIALYFFAKDYESYERNFKGLVDSMVKNDLALKGNLDGVELLIFPSNQLPDSCQRWNMLFFLWGVFRVRKVSCSNSSKYLCNAGSNMDPLDRDITTDNMSLSKYPCLPKNSAACDAPHNTIRAPYGPARTCITMNGNCDNNLSSVQQTSLVTQSNSVQQDGGRFDSRFSSRTLKTVAPLSAETRREECKVSDSGGTEFKSCLQAFRTNIGFSKGRVTDRTGGSSLGEDSSMKNCSGGNEGIHDDGSVDAEKVSDTMRYVRGQINLEEDLNEGSPCVEIAHGTSETARDQINLETDLNKGTVETGKVPDIMKHGRCQIDLERDLNKRIIDAEVVPDTIKRDGDQINLDRDLADERVNVDTSLERHLSLKGINHQQSKHWNAPHLDLAETAAAASSCDISQKMPWNGAFFYGESISKKLKTGSAGAYECSNSRDGDSCSDSFLSRRVDLCPSSSNQKRSEEFLVGEVIPKDLGSSERYFFPVASHGVNDLGLGANSMPWKDHLAKDGDQFLDGVPNLNLALGAETKQPNKGMLPFFLDKNSPDPVADKGAEEDVSAALSLSLSFPFPDKEQTAVKPASKNEQTLPDGHQVNSSLLLFGGYLNK